MFSLAPEPLSKKDKDEGKRKFPKGVQVITARLPKTTLLCRRLFPSLSFVDYSAIERAAG